MSTLPLWKPLNPEVAAYPYDYYADLRKNHPVFRSQTGEWIISRYDDIKTILGDKQTFLVGNRLQWMEHASAYASRKGLDYSAIPEALQSFILFKNPPEHTSARKWIHTHWTNEVNNDALLSRLFFSRTDSFDFVEEIAKPLPLFSISKVLGLPESDGPKLKEWSYEIIRVMDLYLTYKDLQRINDASIHLLQYFVQIIRDPSKLDREGIIYRLLQDGPRKENEMASAFIFLFIAGQETTSAFLGTMMMHIADKKLLPKLRNYKLEDVVEEFLRFDPPVQLLGRISQENVNISESNIPAGSTLTLCLGAANRDPEVFEAPDELRFDRPSNPNFSFGFGIHRCLGEAMALSIAKDFLAFLIEHVESIEQVGESASWDRHLSVRRLTHLNLKLAWK